MCKKSIVIRFLKAIFILFGLSACNFAMRGVIVVDCDVGELRDAIISANQHSNTTVIDLAEDCDYEMVRGPYNTDARGGETYDYGRHGLPAITTPIIIEGNNAFLVRVSNSRAPNNNFRFFMITETGELTLIDLTLMGGEPSVPDQVYQGGGAIYLHRGSLTLDGVRISSNQVKAYGGGIFNDSGTVSIRNSSFDMNTAHSGGGFVNWNGTVEIDENSEFISNVATLEYGGAIYSVGDLTVRESRFSGNEAETNGGAIMSINLADSSHRNQFGLDDVDFEYNFVKSITNTQAGGGAIYINGVEFSINESRFIGNQAFKGGAIWNNTGEGWISDSEFDQNYGRAGGGAIYNGHTGGGIVIGQSDLIISTCNVHDNVSGEKGGGIFNSESLEVLSSHINANSAGSFGGGISSMHSGTLKISGSTIFDNTAQSAGGGIDGNGSVTITNSTISGNQSNGVGGMYLTGTDTKISHSTIVFNTSEGGSGGGIHTVGDISIKNSIVALNDPQDCEIYQNFAPTGDNLHSDGTCVGFNIEAGPRLYPPRLMDNGGPTLTHALHPDSPAVDAAPDCTTVGLEPVNDDQRGYSRENPTPGGLCDIGAFELDAAAPPVPVDRPSPLEFPDDTDCYAGPEADQEVVTQIPAGETALPVGRNGDASWLALPDPEGDPSEVWCWVPKGLVLMDFDPMGLPIIDWEPLPDQEAGECTFTASMNLFCREGPGSSVYPEIDEFTAGESAPVIGISEDGNFYYVLGVNFGKACTVPSNPKYGETEGDCQDLPVLAAPPPPMQEPDQPLDQPAEPQYQGCWWVKNPTQKPVCVVPCPNDAYSGTGCNP
jgi:predicted outer membrane repeat protein